jgi:hypothetical protein
MDEIKDGDLVEDTKRHMTGKVWTVANGVAKVGFLGPIPDKKGEHAQLVENVPLSQLRKIS